jgi:hypothetical protein
MDNSLAGGRRQRQSFPINLDVLLRNYRPRQSGFCEVPTFSAYFVTPVRLVQVFLHECKHSVIVIIGHYGVEASASVIADAAHVRGDNREAAGVGFDDSRVRAAIAHGKKHGISLLIQSAQLVIVELGMPFDCGVLKKVSKNSVISPVIWDEKVELHVRLPGKNGRHKPSQHSNIAQMHTIVEETLRPRLRGIWTRVEKINIHAIEDAVDLRLGHRGLEEVEIATIEQNSMLHPL